MNEFLIKVSVPQVNYEDEMVQVSLCGEEIVPFTPDEIIEFAAKNAAVKYMYDSGISRDTTDFQSGLTHDEINIYEAKIAELKNYVVYKIYNLIGTNQKEA